MHVSVGGMTAIIPCPTSTQRKTSEVSSPVKVSDSLSVNRMLSRFWWRDELSCGHHVMIWKTEARGKLRGGRS